MRHHIGKSHRPRRGDIKQLFLKREYNRKDLRRNARGEWTSDVRLKTMALHELPDEVGNETTDRKLRGTNQSNKTIERYIAWKTSSPFFKYHVGWSHEVFLDKLKRLANNEAQYRSISYQLHGDGLVCWGSFSRDGRRYYSEIKYSMNRDGCLDEDSGEAIRHIYNFCRTGRNGDKPKHRLLYKGDIYQRLDGFWYRIGIVDEETYNRMTCIPRPGAESSKWYKADTIKLPPQLDGVDEEPGKHAISKHQVDGKLSKVLDSLALA